MTNLLKLYKLRFLYTWKSKNYQGWLNLIKNIYTSKESVDELPS